MADQVAVMHLGKFVEAGPVDRIFSAPAHPYTRELLSSNRSLDPLSALNCPPMSG
jgi:peptide/nickel transport system ATP-binding protein